MHFRLKGRKPGLLCKLDLEESYDMVDWGFILYMLRRMGFMDKWRSSMLECISYAWFSVIINGSPTGFFPAQRGLRQGDLLSPLLSVIVGEAFSRMLVAANTGNLIFFSLQRSCYLLSSVRGRDSHFL